MTRYRLFYKGPAAKDIKKLPKQVQKRLKLKLEWFVSQGDPMSFAEHLIKPTDAQYRYRVGVYRVLFDIDKENIIILKVQQRKDVYR